MDTTLKEVRPGNSITTHRPNSIGLVKKKLMSMGPTKDTEVYIRKVAPPKNPIEFTVRGHELSTREVGTALVEVE